MNVYTLYYPICGLCGSYDHDTNGHNKIISLEREINLRNHQHAFKRCEAYGSLTHTTTDHYDIEWFKRGEALQAKEDEALRSTRAESLNANRSKTLTKRKPIWYLDSGCSRHMTGVKSYLHKYVEQLGPKVLFGDDSTCTTEGYGSIKCNGIVFTKVAFVDGLKYNLISINQLCDAKYIVQFDEKRGTIFNANKEILMIAPRVRDVYVLDMTSPAQESCFFAKASKNLNWLWHKRLAHLNFKTINKLAKQNLVIGFPSLVYLKDKPCSSCEKGKHHRANFKTKQTSSIKKCLHLLHMDLFGLVTPGSINHEKYTLVIVDEYSRKFDEKSDDGYLLGYSLVSKAFRVFNTRRQQTKETYHITFDESPDAIKFSKPSVDNINIAENERYPPDEYLHPYEPSQSYQTNKNDVSFIKPYESPEPFVLETKVSSDQNGQNDQTAHTDEILNDNLSKQDTLVQDTISIPNPPLPIPSLVTPAPQDRWSQDKHIELVNIIRNPGDEMLARAMAKQLSATSSHECLFVDFLFEEEPKKVSKALKHLGWVDSMQDELSQFAKNKVWTLVPAPYGKTIIGSKWVFRNKRDETRIVIKNKARLIKQSKRGISINQEKYVKDLLKKYDINDSSVKTPMGPPNNLRPDLSGKLYQTNPKESHLIAVKRIFRYLKGKAPQVLVPIFCDNTSAIVISNNPVMHSRTKHIDIRYHFIRDHILKRDIELHFIPTQCQLADIFTKPLDEPTFKILIVELGMLNIDSKLEA
ncbi:retrovirus-related pol polyprotein from transposon TNT 1-94 [Tanacetum coccineum]